MQKDKAAERPATRFFTPLHKCRKARALVARSHLEGNMKHVIGRLALAAFRARSGSNERRVKIARDEAA
jgi:hypothetical protein